MSTAAAPAPWPAPAGAVPAWRFARLVPRAGAAAPALQWALRRNCSITPRQFVLMYLGLCAVSLLIGLGFWWQGAGVVLAFAGVELLAFGLALCVYARHAADRETITLADRAVEVEQHFGPQVERASFRAEWLSIEPAQAQGSLVELAGEGRRVLVGRYVRPEQRAALAQEMRRALRRAQAGLPPLDTQESELESQR
jgi:uncharacterized membrane protein